jgi:hypothetical protein
MNMNMNMNMMMMMHAFNHKNIINIIAPAGGRDGIKSEHCAHCDGRLVFFWLWRDQQGM